MSGFIDPQSKMTIGAADTFDLFFAHFVERDEEIKRLNEENKSLKEQIDKLNKENTRLLCNNSDNKTLDNLDDNKLRLVEAILKSVDEHFLEENNTHSYNWSSSAASTSNSNNNNISSSSEDESTGTNSSISSNNTTLYQPHHIPFEVESNISNIITNETSTLNNNNNYNNNNHNNNNNNDQYTVFISWTGSTTMEELRGLFDTDDIVDVRHTQGKQFAHVDLKTSEALQKAIGNRFFTNRQNNNNNNNNRNNTNGIQTQQKYMSPNKFNNSPGFPNNYRNNNNANNNNNHNYNHVHNGINNHHINNVLINGINNNSNDHKITTDNNITSSSSIPSNNIISPNSNQQDHKNVNVVESN
nr:4857_t:CDS:2 [Entrophospora candida]